MTQWGWYWVNRSIIWEEWWMVRVVRVLFISRHIVLQKCPYFPLLRKLSVQTFCEMLRSFKFKNSYFPNVVLSSLTFSKLQMPHIGVAVQLLLDQLYTCWPALHKVECYISYNFNTCAAALHHSRCPCFSSNSNVELFKGPDVSLYHITMLSKQFWFQSFCNISGVFDWQLFNWAYPPVITGDVWVCSLSLSALTPESLSVSFKDTLRDCQPEDQHCLTYLPLVSPIYFVTFVLMAQFVLVNVVVAVLMKHLEESNKVH